MSYTAYAIKSVVVSLVVIAIIVVIIIYIPYYMGLILERRRNAAQNNRRIQEPIVQPQEDIEMGNLPLRYPEPVMIRRSQHAEEEDNWPLRSLTPALTRRQTTFGLGKSGGNLEGFPYNFR